MENSRWFLLVTFCIVGLTQGSVNADILFSGATGGFNSEGNLVDASTGAPLHSPFFNLYSGPGILPQTGLYVGNTSVTGTVSGVTSFNSVPDAATVSANMQYSLTGGPTLPNEGATMSGGAGFDYRITGDGPSESQFYYISGQGEIKGYLAAGDTLSYSASAILGNGSFYSQGASGTLTDPGAFDIPVIAPRTLFAYQHGAEIVDYSGGFTTISMSLTATFTKGTSGGTSYIN